MGLAGLGDLVLTCTDDHSRNRRFGLALGQGAAVEQALARHRSGGRGLPCRAARCAAWPRASRSSMPIAEGIYRRALRAAAGRAGGARPDDCDRSEPSSSSPLAAAEVHVCRQASYTTTATALARLRLRLPGLHRNASAAALGGHACQHRRRQTAGLASRTAAHRPAAIPRLAVAARGAGLDGEQPRARQRHLRQLRQAVRLACVETLGELARSPDPRVAPRADPGSNPSGSIRCRRQPVLAHRRMMLPVFGGISRLVQDDVKHLRPV